MDLLEALKAYKQADEDGVMVRISRQACDEAHDEIERLRASHLEMIAPETVELMIRTAEARIAELTAALERLINTTLICSEWIAEVKKAPDAAESLRADVIEAQKTLASDGSAQEGE